MTVTVVVTREPPRNDELMTALSGLARVMEIPLTMTEYRDEDEVLSELAQHPHHQQWSTVVVTSARATSYVSGALAAAHPDAVVGVVGRATAQVLQLAEVVGGRTLLVPEIESGANLGALVTAGPVLVLGARESSPELAETLMGKGLLVDAVAVYETTPGQLTERARRELASAEVVVITAPSAWRAARANVHSAADVVTVGPTTTSAVRRDHHRVVEAERHELAVVVALLVARRDPG